MKCTEATVESVQGKTEVRILQPHYYYFAVLGCDSAVLGLSACHFSPDSHPTVSNSDVLLPVSLLTHSLFHTRTSATMSGQQTRSKTKYDQPAAAAPKAGSTSKRKPDSSGKGDKPARKKKQDAGTVPAKMVQETIAAETPGASASKMAAMASKTRIEKKDTAAKQRQDCTCIVIPSGTR